MNARLRSTLPSLLFLALLLARPLVVPAQSPQLVAPTDPLPPAEQRAKFHLPPGFEIQLVVAEDVIGQPMNLNFDAAGRLWITSSVEYPYPARGEGVQDRDANFGTPGEHAPRDRVVVLDGIGAPDDTPVRITVFATGLNIPIGIVPIGDRTNGDQALVFGIPAIQRHADTDGDFRADEVTRLIDGFGNVDTHGMTNGFTRWIDGWIYACHGFRNTSRLRLATRPGDDVVLEMNSGNTYRFREDGSAIEQFTWGQVNPFGLTFDPWGHAYTADCHSRPLTALIRGAYYSSFGKPHDGLGYGPDMIDHEHGSTGICGPAYYAADHFPPAYRDNLFLCNPVTGRIHRDRLIDRGSTRFVDSQPDFLTCDDPWFRPVDCQVGPDGCLYVADFYNAVIGHYEVPLPHPKRDRTHGRVWRIAYRGDDGRGAAPVVPNLTLLDLDPLVTRLGDPNLVVRQLATNLIVDRHGDAAAPAVRALLTGDSSTPEQRVHGLWVLQRIGGLDEELLRHRANDSSPLVRTHVARILAERPDWSPQAFDVVRGMLTEANPFVRRAAADALGRQPAPPNVAALLAGLANTPEEDTHLRHTLRIALRNHVRDDAVAESLRTTPPASGLDEIASVSLAVHSANAAALLTAWLDRADVPESQVQEATRHIAQTGSSETLDALLATLSKRYAGDPRRTVRLLVDLSDGLRRRGMEPGESQRTFATATARALLDTEDDTIAWPTSPDVENTWAVERRPCADGREADFFSTLPKGETVTGTRRSAPFPIPASFEFFVAGHCGPPPAACHGRNLVRLVDAATGDVLAESIAPRNDTAQRVAWDLTGHVGRSGYLELVDGDTGTGYAWIAVGRFSLPGLDPGRFSPRSAAMRLIADYGLSDLVAEWRAAITDDALPLESRLAAAEGVLTVEPDARLGALLGLLRHPRTPDPVRDAMMAGFAARDFDRIHELSRDGTLVLSTLEQTEFAETLAGDRAGGESLLTLLEFGRLSPRLLADPALRQRLVAARVENAEARIAALTRDLPAADERIAAAIANHRQSFAAGSHSAERGRLAFEKSCAACHRIGGRGAIVGPQLDGVGIRGLDRLLEDVLDPNRNVDEAFRVTTLVLTDGRIRTGLFRREEGATSVFADDKGKEFTVVTAEIDERVKSPLSLMPTNLLEILPANDIDDLLQYLLDQRRPAE